MGDECHLLLHALQLSVYEAGELEDVIEVHLGLAHLFCIISSTDISFCRLLAERCLQYFLLFNASGVNRYLQRWKLWIAS